MVLIIGHRGCAYEQENTIKTFKRALDLKVDMIEFDIWQCKSGEIVVFHDDNLKRLHGINKKIKNINYSELKKLNIPLLKDVLNLVKGKVKVNIELKDEVSENLSAIINKYLQKGWQEKDFLISAFDYDEIKKFHALMPKIPIGLLPEGLTFKKQIDELSPYSIHLSKDKISKKLVETLHQKGLKVFVYIINSDFKKIIDLGIDGIFSDYPDKIPR